MIIMLALRGIVMNFHEYRDTTFLLNFNYTSDMTLGAPDMIEILDNPIKVAEKNHTIYVLDQERASKTIKEYTFGRMP